VNRLEQFTQDRNNPNKIVVRAPDGSVGTVDKTDFESYSQEGFTALSATDIDKYTQELATEPQDTESKEYRIHSVLTDLRNPNKIPMVSAGGEFGTINKEDIGDAIQQGFREANKDDIVNKLKEIHYSGALAGPSENIQPATEAGWKEITMADVAAARQNQPQQVSQEQSIQKETSVLARALTADKEKLKYFDEDVASGKYMMIDTSGDMKAVSPEQYKFVQTRGYREASPEEIQSKRNNIIYGEGGLNKGIAAVAGVLRGLTMSASDVVATHPLESLTGSILGYSSGGLPGAIIQGMTIAPTVRSTLRPLGIEAPAVYEDYKNAMKEEIDQLQEQNPGPSIAGEIAGAVIPALFSGGMSIEATAALKVAQTTKAAAAAGAKIGFMSKALDTLRSGIGIVPSTTGSPGALSLLGRKIEAKVLGSALEKTALRRIEAKMASGAAEGAIYGATSEIGRISLEDDPLAWESILPNFGQVFFGSLAGGTLGAAVPGAIGVGKGVLSVRHPIARTADKALTKLLSTSDDSMSPTIYNETKKVLDKFNILKKAGEEAGEEVEEAVQFGLGKPKIVRISAQAEERIAARERLTREFFDVLPEDLRNRMAEKGFIFENVIEASETTQQEIMEQAVRMLSKEKPTMGDILKKWYSKYSEFRTGNPSEDVWNLYTELNSGEKQITKAIGLKNKDFVTDISKQDLDKIADATASRLNASIGEIRDAANKAYTAGRNIPENEIDTFVNNALSDVNFGALDTGVIYSSAQRVLKDIEDMYTILSAKSNRANYRYLEGIKGIGFIKERLKSDIDIANLPGKTSARRNSEIYYAINKAKQYVDNYIPYGKDRTRLIKPTVDQIISLRGRLKDHLEDVSVYGDDIAAVHQLNDSFSTSKRLTDSLLKMFGSPKITKGGKKVVEIDPAKLKTFLRKSGRIEGKAGRETIREFIDNVTYKNDYILNRFANIEQINKLVKNLHESGRLLEVAGKKSSAMSLGSGLGRKFDLIDIGAFAATFASSGVMSPLIVATQMAKSPAYEAMVINKMLKFSRNLSNKLDIVPSLISRGLVISPAREKVKEAMGVKEAKAATEGTVTFTPAKKQEPQESAVTQMYKKENISDKQVVEFISKIKTIKDIPVETIEDLAAEHASPYVTTMPKTFASVYGGLLNMAEFLTEKVPEMPELNDIFIQTDEKGRTYVSNFELAKFKRYYAYTFKPDLIIDDFSNGIVNKEGVEVLERIYPNIYKEIKETMLDLISDGRIKDQNFKNKIKTLFKIQDTNISRLQSAFVPTEEEAPTGRKPSEPQVKRMVNSAQTQAQRISQK